MNMTRAGTHYTADIVRVRRTLQHLENVLAAERNPQAWFVALYRTTTTRCCWLVTGISRQDHPRHASLLDMDPRLIRDIVVHFEPRYTRRLRTYRAGALDESDPWYPVFHHGASLGPFATLVLGAYTHIAFDLPLVLAATLDDGRPLHDDSEPRQVNTFKRLNHWFSLDIGRVAIRVSALSHRMGFPNAPALVGRCRFRRQRSWSTPLWRLLLAHSRRCAVSDARLIRAGKLDESALANRVRRNNLRLIAMFHWLPWARQPEVNRRLGGCSPVLRER